MSKTDNLEKENTVRAMDKTDIVRPRRFLLVDAAYKKVFIFI